MPEERPEYGPQAELARVTTNMRTVRGCANTEARDAIRRAERELIRALGGERLSQTPNLATAKEPLYGYRIRAKHVEEKLEDDGKETLVLGAKGELQMVWRNRAGVGWRQARDDDFRGEDLSRVLEIVEYAVAEHIEKATRRTRRFQNIRELADKVQFILGED